MPLPSRLADLHAALAALGGVAERAELVHASSAATLRAALARKEIHRVHRGLYAAVACSDPRLGRRAPTRAWSRWADGPDDGETTALRARHAHARARRAALSHRSAAAHHGWAMLVEPECLDLAVPYSRRGFDAVGAQRVRVHRRALTQAERDAHVTAPLRTVLDCAADLPWPQALAIADSARRSGLVGASELTDAGEAYRGRNRAQVRRVAGAADPRADNPFESALRAVCLDVPEIEVEPQVEIVHGGGRSRVDLADRRRRIVVEADSYEFHGSVERFRRDRRRYAELTVDDWLVLPVTFDAVTRRPDWVADILRGATYVRDRQVRRDEEPR